MEYTRGPWRAWPDGAVTAGGLEQNNVVVAQVEMEGVCEAQGFADARLIAAAPDLLAAAEACFATVSYPAPDGGAWWRLTSKEVDMLRAAIAKARRS